MTTHLVRRAVGNGQDNDDDDILTTKRAFAAMGRLKPSATGFHSLIDKPLDDAIRGFQDERNMRWDGIIKPGGETERTMLMELGKLPKPKPSPQQLNLSGPVGNRLSNDEPDVRAVEGGLMTLGAMKLRADPRSLITRELEGGIRTFQQKNGLKNDGVVNPGGPTLATLRTKLFGDEKKPAAAAATAQLVQKTDRPEGAESGVPNASLPALVGAGDAAEVSRAAQAVQKAPHKAFMDKIEKFYWGYVRAGRKRGMNEAADNLEHYLKGSGKPRIYSRQKARGFKPIRDAEDLNQGRFRDKTFVGKSGDKKQNERLRGLQDGQSMTIGDYWDRSYGRPQDVPDIVARQRDFYLAFGRTNVNSRSNIRATRDGDTIYIEGTVTHLWDDEYDFEPNRSLADGAIALERHRGAKPFKFGATWTQRVRGSVEIRNGELTNPKAQWTDIGE